MMSLRAKGLLCMILSNVDEWVVTKAWVAANCTEGRDAIRSAFNELVELGYASVEEQDQMDDGKFAKQIWTFRDEPAAVRKPAKITPNFGHIDPKSAENPQSPSDDRVRESAQNSPKSAENRIRKPAQKGPKSAENRQREPVNGNPPTKNTIEEDHKETESGDAAKARTRNELADHLAKVCGSDISRMTDGEWKRVGVALAGIKKVEPELTKDSIDAHVAGYRRIFKDAIMTPLALMNNWGATAPMARPDAKPAVSTQDELQRLVERLSAHVANPRHTSMFGDLITEKQKDEFETLKRRYYELKGQASGGAK